MSNRRHRSRPNHIKTKRYGPLLLFTSNVDQEGEPRPHMGIKHMRRGVVVLISEDVMADLLRTDGHPEPEAFQRFMHYAEILYGFVTRHEFTHLMDAICDYYPELLNQAPPREISGAEHRARLERDRVKLWVNGEPLELY